MDRNGLKGFLKDYLLLDGFDSKSTVILEETRRNGRDSKRLEDTERDSRRL